MPDIKHARTSVLDIAYEESGTSDGVPVLLMHGFPYAPRAFDGVVPLLAAKGCRVIVPYLRGYGPTRFFRRDTPRSGQQAALGIDLLELLDALEIERAVLAGYDWGGRAACVVSALWPQRVRGLVTGGGYNIQDVPDSAKPAAPEREHRTGISITSTERGRAGLDAEPARNLPKLLWRLWSPKWTFDDGTYDGDARRSFDNPDFVAVVIQSYRIVTAMCRAIPRWPRSRTKLGAQAEDHRADHHAAGRGDGYGAARGSESTQARTSPGHTSGA